LNLGDSDPGRLFEKSSKIKTKKKLIAQPWATRPFFGTLLCSDSFSARLIVLTIDFSGKLQVLEVLYKVKSLTRNLFAK
jgi:hypothetical protein